MNREQPGQRNVAASLSWMLAPDRLTPRLPVPHFNVLNGGVHAPNQLDFEEFMVAPLGAPNERTSLAQPGPCPHASHLTGVAGPSLAADRCRRKYPPPDGRETGRRSPAGPFPGGRAGDQGPGISGRGTAGRPAWLIALAPWDLRLRVGTQGPWPARPRRDTLAPDQGR